MDRTYSRRTFTRSDPVRLKDSPPFSGSSISPTSTGRMSTTSSLQEGSGLPLYPSIPRPSLLNLWFSARPHRFEPNTKYTRTVRRGLSPAAQPTWNPFRIKIKDTHENISYQKPHLSSTLTSSPPCGPQRNLDKKRRSRVRVARVCQLGVLRVTS